MKKQRILIAIMAVAAALCLAGCNKKEDKAQSNVASFNIKQKKNVKTAGASLSLDNDRVSFASMSDFFKPDYSVETPDNFSNGSDAGTEKASKKDKKGKQTTSVIPAIR